MPAPPLGRQSKQTQRDLTTRNAKFSQITPGTLRQILDKAARGDFEDFADLCDRMVREDDQVRATYETRVSAVAGTRYAIEAPKGADAISEAFARFCDDALRNLRPQPDPDTGTIDWSSLDDTGLAMRLLDGIRPGFACAELDWHAARRAAGEIQIGDWVPRTAWWAHQRRFIFDDDWQLKLRDDGSRVSGDGIPLEPDKWIVHIPQTVTGYPTQTGVFHSVAWHFMFKRWGAQWWMDGMERFAWPTPYVTVPRETTEETRAVYQDMLDNLTQGIGGVFDEGSAIALLESGVKDGASWQRWVEWCDKGISKAILGNTDSTEPGKVGAWKAVESRTGTTVHPRMSLDAQGLASTYQTQLFERLRRHNPRFAAAALPSIRWFVSSERRDIAPHIIAAGVVTINEVRASLNLPPVPGGEALVSGQPGGLGAPQARAAAPESTPAPSPAESSAPEAPAAAAASAIGPQA